METARAGRAQLGVDDASGCWVKAAYDSMFVSIFFLFCVSTVFSFLTNTDSLESDSQGARAPRGSGGKKNHSNFKDEYFCVGCSPNRWGGKCAFNFLRPILGSAATFCRRGGDHFGNIVRNNIAKRDMGGRGGGPRRQQHSKVNGNCKCDCRRALHTCCGIPRLKLRHSRGCAACIMADSDCDIVMRIRIDSISRSTTIPGDSE